MSSVPPNPPAPHPAPETAGSPSLAPSQPSGSNPRLGSPLTWAALAVAGVALLASVSLWQRLGHLQEQLARQSADSGNQAVEARTLARQAQELARDATARVTLNETRLSEVALQRTQLEELMQSLSRSRDENLVVDIESALRLAQQQAQLTGSVEPLLAALKTAEQRIARAAQPRLAPLQRAIQHDTDRIKTASVTDTPGLLSRLDELARQVDELPVLNAVALVPGNRALSASTGAGSAKTAPASAASQAQDWWENALQKSWGLVRDEVRNLVRVSRIDQPEAALLAPEQSFFLRENLKLKLLNARLGVLARQTESARADLAAAAVLINKYFDPASRRTQVAATLMQQLQGQLRAVELPRLDETLTALATAAAGR
ncbi:uroporphyrinogen-III C-methyltransferase [Curvibacter sp. RS43]|uniref:Uroporphyrinogen-III C-methyltransferase n=1 Tax=Curvibacter microcysteis TaxID=3026419 RepID=A0ABT5MLG9_9BURK|nr:MULTISPECIES: uroporphyrinogen-III C-methyltransferase [unclassified Curvibacter]MDD0812028.1 uroporphyrinogen-III C-methyltransferase [Curvibacter sp. RS43]MDD0817236.1 uroporphyrinogen-III C-methyltransferase [Curvibacter sp. HBC28]